MDQIDYKTTLSPEGEVFLMDLILSEKGGNTVTICATDEPNPKDFPLLLQMPQVSRWTIVVWDETILEKLGRGRFSQTLE